MQSVANAQPAAIASLVYAGNFVHSLSRNLYIGISSKVDRRVDISQVHPRTTVRVSKHIIGSRTAAPPATFNPNRECPYRFVAERQTSPIVVVWRTGTSTTLSAILLAYRRPIKIKTKMIDKSDRRKRQATATSVSCVHTIMSNDVRRRSTKTRQALGVSAESCG